MRSNYAIASLVFFVLLFREAGAQNVVLSEIMFDPAGEETSDEFIELYNTRSFHVNLEGWRITDGADTDRVVALDQGLHAAPHQYILILDPDYIVDSSGTYSGLVPRDALILTIDDHAFATSGLSNSSRRALTLLTHLGEAVSSYRYSVGNPEGHSDEKILMQAGDVESNWANSLALHGTPGSPNSVTPPLNDLAVTQFSYSPRTISLGDSFSLQIQITNLGQNVRQDSVALFRYQLTDTQDSLHRIAGWQTPTLIMGDSVEFEQGGLIADAPSQVFLARITGTDEQPQNNERVLAVNTGGAPGTVVINEIMYAPESGRCEWVELLNASNFPWRLDHWRFYDGTGIRDTLRRFSLPEITLPGGSYIVLASDSSIMFENIPMNIPFAVWDSIPITLNNNGDSLLLVDQDGQQVDRVDYRPSWLGGLNGVSLERISEMVSSNDPSNWAGSVDSTGSTPGRMNSRSLRITSGPTAALTLEPNPFTPNSDGRDDVLHIRYCLDHADSRIDLKVFDARGRLIRRLANAEPAGLVGESLWDGRDGSGRDVPTGLYIIYLEAMGKGGTRVQTDKRPVALARRS